MRTPPRSSSANPGEPLQLPGQSEPLLPGLDGSDALVRLDELGEGHRLPLKQALPGPVAPPGNTAVTWGVRIGPLERTREADDPCGDSVSRAGLEPANYGLKELVWMLASADVRLITGGDARGGSPAIVGAVTMLVTVSWNLRAETAGHC